MHLQLLLPRRLPHAEAAKVVGAQSIVFRPGNKGTRGTLLSPWNGGFQPPPARRQQLLPANKIYAKVIDTTIAEQMSELAAKEWD